MRCARSAIRPSLLDAGCCAAMASPRSPTGASLATMPLHTVVTDHVPERAQGLGDHRAGYHRVAQGFEQVCTIGVAEPFKQGTCLTAATPARTGLRCLDGSEQAGLGTQLPPSGVVVLAGSKVSAVRSAAAIPATTAAVRMPVQPRMSCTSAIWVTPMTAINALLNEAKIRVASALSRFMLLPCQAALLPPVLCFGCWMT